MALGRSSRGAGDGTVWGAMGVTDLHLLGACEAARLIREGAVTSVDLVQACLARVREVDGQVQAWAFLDPEYALAQARAADEYRASGQTIGALHGVPVGLKDIIDTEDLPTEYNSPIYRGHQPRADAACVAQLKRAGCLVLGKTVTTEFANNHPMVPLALGSQTTGSTIRPASYCGVYGLKPTHGLVPRHGMLQLSRTLDHVGLFARSIDDVALLLEELASHDERDPDSRPRARVPYRTVTAEEPPLTPMFGLVKTSLWEQIDADARDAFDELVEHLGDRVEEVELVTPAADVLEWQRAIGGAEIAINLRREWENGRDRLSAALRARIEHGRAVRALDYLSALGRVPELNASLTELFEQRYDAILTPAAFGTAPKGLESTGDPAFCALWTLCGLPALNVPLMQGANGLPLGVQVVGARHRDAQLLRTARWLVAHLANAA